MRGSSKQARRPSDVNVSNWYQGCFHYSIIVCGRVFSFSVVVVSFHNSDRSVVNHIIARTDSRRRVLLPFCPWYNNKSDKYLCPLKKSNKRQRETWETETKSIGLGIEWELFFMVFWAVEKYLCLNIVKTEHQRESSSEGKLQIDFLISWTEV